MSEQALTNKSPGLVCTFYSYKGGVGRSMALANVGVLMAAAGHRVLLVDWDLEAPGLEVFFRNAKKLSGDPTVTPGVVDLLDAQAQGTPLSWRDCLLKAEFFGQSLDILSAGRRTDDYRRRVQQLDWDTLFREHRIGNYINSLRDEWRNAYDFVLIDSRTGITDIGDICTVILPDILVLLFVTNYQNVEGIKGVMSRAVKARSKLPINRNKLLGVPVPARDERYHDYDKSVEWQQIFANEFSELYREWLPKEVSPADALNHIFLPYVSGWSFGERLPVVESERERADPTSLGAAYGRLATLLAHRLDWSAIDAKASSADVAGARVELAKAREDARYAETRLAEEAKKREEEVRAEEEKRKEAEARLAQIQQAAVRAKKRSRVLRRIATVLFLLVLVGGYWWYQTHPTPRQFAMQLKDPRSSERAAACDALGNIALTDKDAVGKYAPEVAKLLSDTDSEVRRQAATTLRWMGKYGADFVPKIAELLKDEDPGVRQYGVFSLGGFPKEAVVYAPAIAGFLKDSDRHTQKWAAETLDRMDKEAGAKFSPEVRQQIDDVLDRSRIDQKQPLVFLGKPKITLTDLGHPTPEKNLTEKLQSPDGKVVVQALDELSNWGREALPFAPAIAKLLKSEDRSVQRKAIDLIGGLAKLDEDAVGKYWSEIVELLESRDSEVQKSAAHTLKSMDKYVVINMPNIVGWLKKDFDPSMRSHALFLLGGHVQEALPLITLLLHDDDYLIRKHAVESLGEIGVDAVQSASRVEELLKDEDAVVRVAAQEALKKIKSKEQMTK